ncbi:MAG: DUF1566 domain-containing protein [Dehalococcoidia bacterium]|nr:DUF1566 domain-containing protein [Dehalococcoidia bacterium]
MTFPFGISSKNNARRGLVLKTGQTTQYSSELDDGYYEKGLAKAYSILTTGDYSGTSNIDLAHYAGGAGAIAFVAATKKITDTGNGLAQFKTGDKIICSGPAEAANILILTVATGNVAGEIVVTEDLTNETPAGVVTIKKREAHSNNCVLDLNTGLMWSRYVADKMGTTSAGLMPWTGQLYDIFQYCAAANTASLGGYTDWYVPDLFQLGTLAVLEGAGTAPDATAFPSWPVGEVFSSSTAPGATTYANTLNCAPGSAFSGALKTAAKYCVLVRGG